MAVLYSCPPHPHLTAGSGFYIKFCLGTRYIERTTREGSVERSREGIKGEKEDNFTYINIIS